MKRIILITNIALILGMQGCSLLDIEAENTISGNIYTSTENLEQALVGAYYNFSGISSSGDGGELMGGDFILIPELLAGKTGDIGNSNFQQMTWQSVDAPFSYTEFLRKKILTVNDRVASNWRRAYETINLVNNILANIEVASGSERNRIEGEALAIRGILYYQLVLLWAPHYNAPNINPSTAKAVPIILDPIDDVNKIPVLSLADLSTVDQVYNQAESDLNDASSLLQPFGTNGTRLSYYAVQAFLARLNLQKGEYGAAELHATNVISGPFSLTATPFAAFGNSANSSEDIFAIQQTLANNAGDVSTGTGVVTYYSSLTESGLGTLGIFQSSLTSSFLLNSPSFEPNDLRFTLVNDLPKTTTENSISTFFHNNLANDLSGLLSPTKFRKGDHVMPLVRLAEMYLLRAEASFENAGGVFGTIPSQAISDLNRIRQRAGIAEIPANFSNASAFFDSLAVERIRELYLEGHLLHDLKRWDSAIGDEFSTETYVNDYAEFESGDIFTFTLPIPQSERDTWKD